MNKNATELNGRNIRNRTHEILFMDLRTWNENTVEIVIDKGKKKKKTILSDQQIERVREVYRNWQDADKSKYSDVPEFCCSVKLLNDDLTDEEKEAGILSIEANDWSLVSSKYIEFIDHDMEIDFDAEIKRIQTEMKNILIAERESKSMLEEAFKGIGYDIE